MSSLFVPWTEYLKLFLFLLVIKTLNSIFNFSQLMSFMPSMLMMKQNQSMLIDKQKQKPNMLNIFNTLIPVMSELFSENNATPSKLKKTSSVDNIIPVNS